MAQEKNSVVWAPTKDKRIKKRGDVYWARFEKKGVVVQESLHTGSFAIAERLVEEIESCILLGVNYKKEKELFETAWPEFLSDKNKGIKTKKVRESTLEQYIWIGEKWFMPFFKDKRLTEIDESLWEKYVDHARSEQSDMVMFNHRKYIKAFLLWAFKKGKLRERPDLYDPDQGEKDSDEDESGPGKCYTMDELRALRDGAEMPFKLAVYMAQYMAMRSREITGLHKKRIDFSKGIINLKPVDTKIGRGRKVPIHEKVLIHLHTQILESEGSPYLFPNRDDKNRPMDKGGFKGTWDRLRTAKKIEGRFHDFRHTWITNALASGMNPVVVSEIAGVSMKVIQSTYLHLSEIDLTKELGKLSL
jgi:integrase